MPWTKRRRTGVTKLSFIKAAACMQRWICFFKWQTRYKWTLFLLALIFKRKRTINSECVNLWDWRWNFPSDTQKGEEEANAFSDSSCDSSKKGHLKDCWGLVSSVCTKHHSSFISVGGCSWAWILCKFEGQFLRTSFCQTPSSPLRAGW